MDASYNNSFGQSDVGASGTGMISGSDASGVGPVISGDSGGDIIISSSDGNRGGTRRWLIIVAILLFVVAVGAGVGALMLGKPNGDRDGSSDVPNSDMRKIFNEYANYVLLGEDSASDFKYDKIANTIPYFGKIDTTELEHYLETSERKFSAFSDAYNTEVGLGDIGKLDDYYRGLVWAQGLSDEEIIGGDIEVVSQYLQRYIDARKKYIVIMKQISENALDAGCVYVEDCYVMSEREIIEIADSTTEMNLISAKMYTEATDVFEDVYNLIYGEET